MHLKSVKFTVGFMKREKVAIRQRPSGKRTNLTSTRTLRLIEQRYRVAAMRRDGKSVVEIAQALNMATSTVTERLKECLNLAIKETNETTDETRQIQLERLDLLIKTYIPLATETHNEVIVDRLTGLQVVVQKPPDPVYAALLLRIEERRSKLLALDMPEQKRTEETAIRVYVGINVDQV